ncbi:MAG: hypothetical protein IJ864_02525 [Alphaproteobacteria bacterium]|nr:hypothetical protein [Alphaproteobacteria bacterium]
MSVEKDKQSFAKSHGLSQDEIDKLWPLLVEKYGEKVPDNAQFGYVFDGERKENTWYVGEDDFQEVKEAMKEDAKEKDARLKVKAAEEKRKTEFSAEKTKSQLEAMHIPGVKKIEIVPLENVPGFKREGR